MTGFDIAVLLIVGFGAATGFARGFVQEILALLAWLFTLFAIRSLHTPLTTALEPTVGSRCLCSVTIPSGGQAADQSGLRRVVHIRL
jgi:hypothetical protein